MSEVAQKDTFTVIKHDVLDSTAARVLSATEFTLLVQALRESFRVEFGFHHAHLAHRIPTISRKRFDAARAGLVSRGFLKPVNGRWGIYTMSDNWQSYTPTPSEAALLRASKQHTKCLSRVPKQPTKSEARVSKQHTKSKVRAPFQHTSCAVSDDFVCQNSTPSYKYKEQNTPPTPQGGEAGGGSLRVAEDIKSTLDAFQAYADLVRWRPPRELTDDEITYAEARRDELWERVERGTHWADGLTGIDLAAEIARRLKAPGAASEIATLIDGRERDAVAAVDAILCDNTVKVPFGMFKYKLQAA